MPYLSDSEIIEKFKEKWKLCGYKDWDGIKYIQLYVAESFLSAQRQQDREVLAETVGELKLQYHCAKCDGAQQLEHTQACKAITDAVFLIRDSWKKE